MDDTQEKIEQIAKDKIQCSSRIKNKIEELVASLKKLKKKIVISNNIKVDGS